MTSLAAVADRGLSRTLRFREKPQTELSTSCLLSQPLSGSSQFPLSTEVRPSRQNCPTASLFTSVPAHQNRSVMTIGNCTTWTSQDSTNGGALSDQIGPRGDWVGNCSRRQPPPLSWWAHFRFPPEACFLPSHAVQLSNVSRLNKISPLSPPQVGHLC